MRALHQLAVIELADEFTGLHVCDSDDRRLLMPASPALIPNLLPPRHFHLLLPFSFYTQTHLSSTPFPFNKFLKIYFDWEHAIFGNPVVYNTNTGRSHLNSDLYWLRFQFYF